MNISLQQLGEIFSADVLKALDAVAGGDDAGDDAGAGATGDPRAVAVAVAAAAGGGGLPVSGLGRGEVKGLVKRRGEGSAVCYKVRWVGRGKDEDTWVPAAEISDAHKQRYETAKAAQKMKEEEDDGARRVVKGVVNSKVTEDGHLQVRHLSITTNRLRRLNRSQLAHGHSTRWRSRTGARVGSNPLRYRRRTQSSLRLPDGSESMPTESDRWAERSVLSIDGVNIQESWKPCS